MSDTEPPPLPMPDPELPEEAARLTRRRLLDTVPNPNRKLDYLTSLCDALLDGSLVVTLTYVPGKLLIRSEAFAAYLAAFPAPASLEALAIELLDDINNEVVPRWVEVRLEQAAPTGSGHRVIIEDREPKWDNPALLSRLR